MHLYVWPRSLGIVRKPTLPFHAGKVTVARSAFLTVSTIALAISGTGDAAAQTQPSQSTDEAEPSQSTDETEPSVDNVIVVTGARAENIKTIEDKRKSSGIADYLSTDEIGDFPDLNIAESLRRIPGVTSIFDEDRGRFVAVRGLNPNLNYVTIDGLGVATTDSFGGTGRRVNLEVIPSRAVSSLEVRKTFTPEIDGGAIGGYVNLRTRSAYDAKGERFIVDGGLNYSTFRDVPEAGNYDGELSSGIGGQFDIVYSNILGSSKEFGIALAGNFLQTQRDELKYFEAGERYYNDAGRQVDPVLDDGSVNPDWNGLVAPAEVRRYAYTNRVQDYGASAKAEYSPDDRLYVSLLGYYFAEGQQETRRDMNLQGFDDISNQTPTSGNLKIGDVTFGWNRNNLDRQNYGAIFSSNFEFADRHVISLASGWSYNDFKNFAPRIVYEGGPDDSAIFYEVIENDPRSHRFAVADTDGLLNPENYRLRTYFEQEVFSKENLYDTKLDYAYNRKPGSYGLGVQIGGEYRRIDRERDNSRTVYDVDRSSLAPVAIQTDYQPGAINFPLLWIDGPAFLAGVAPALSINEQVTRDRAALEDFRYVEDTLAGYGLLSYTGERFQIIGGLRYEDISTQAITPGEDLSDPFIIRDGGYDKFLPSATLAYDITDNLRFKLGLSRSAGRANPGDVAQRERVSLENQTIRRGNPDIKPRVSDNVDIGFEYFPPGGESLLSAAFFYKNIADEIFDLTEIEVIDGIEFDVRTPRNAEGAKVKGIELGYIQNSLDFLPAPFNDFGISANVTYVDGEISFINSAGEFETSDRLIEQSRWSGNASLFYNYNDVFEAQISYNYQGKYLDDLAPRPWERRAWDTFESVGINLRYSLSDQMIIKVKGRNLFNNNRVRVRGLELNDLDFGTEFGQQFFVSLIYKP